MMDENDLVAMSDARLYRTLVEAHKADAIQTLREEVATGVQYARRVPDTETVQNELRQRDADRRGISLMEVEMQWQGDEAIPSCTINREAFDDANDELSKLFTRALNNERGIV